jgi:hypothetical protein
MSVKRHLQFVLHRESLDSSYKWTLVRAYSLQIDWGGHKPVQFFAYREGRVMKSFDAGTGVCLAIGPTLPRTRINTVRILNRTNPKQLQRVLNDMLKLANPGPKPPLPKIP